MNPIFVTHIVVQLTRLAFMIYNRLENMDTKIGPSQQKIVMRNYLF